MKICLVGNSGGHLYQLHILKDWWSRYDRFWVTFDRVDARSLLHEERSYSAYFPATGNLLNLIRNTFLAFRILMKERPDLIVSTGAAVAVPFFYVGKLFGSKLVFIEVFDRIDSPTLTGRMVHPVADAFILQWDEQKRFFRKGKVLGRIL